MCSEGSDKLEGTATIDTDLFYKLVIVEEFQFAGLH